MSKKKIFTGVMVVAFIFSIVALAVPQGTVSAATEERWGGPGGRGGNGWGDDSRGRGRGSSGTALTPLTDAEAEGLQEAILEEYGAFNLYQAVIEQFGEVYPFPQIARSEQQHANALIRQAEKYGVEVPVNPGLETAPVFASIEEACEAGVTAEIVDAELYDELMQFTTHDDLIRVYTRLQSASLESHLPAFEACQ